MDIRSATRIGATAPGPRPFARARRSHATRKKTSAVWEHSHSMLKAWLDEWRFTIDERHKASDVVAGLTVAAVALPLNIALAVAAGLPPTVGLLAGAIGGAVAAIFGGSTWQVSGPSATFNVIVFGLFKDYGTAGVAASCVVACAVQLALAFGRAGTLMRYVPECVLAGFTTGVGIKLLDGQVPHLLGIKTTLLELLARPHDLGWLQSVQWHATVSGLLVAVTILALGKWRFIPAGLLGLVLVTALSSHLGWGIDRVGSLPKLSLAPTWPSLAVSDWLGLAWATLPLAFLAAVESLASAGAADRLAHGKKTHHPGLELFGQALGNLASGLVGGMPIAGVIIRSSVNIQCGAKTRLASLAHGGMILGSMLFLGNLISNIPLAGLAGLLSVVVMRLIHLKTFFQELRDDKLSALAFAVTAVATVSGYLVTGLAIGLALYGLSVSRRPKAEASARGQGPNIRADLQGSTTPRRRPRHRISRGSPAPWLANIKEQAQVPPTAFVHPDAVVIGRVVLGDDTHVAAGSCIRADEGSPFYIGPESNIQDGAVLHALKNRFVRVAGEPWAIYIGRGVSIAHQALVHGPCYIGDGSFIGFKAVVYDAVVGPRAFVGIGATIVGVEIKADRYVPHGAVVDTPEKAAALPAATEAQRSFNDDVVDVNLGLAAAYHAERAETKVAPTHLKDRRADTGTALSS